MSRPDHDWREALYEAEAARLLLYGRALGLSHWEAEDVLQDLFLSLAGQQAPPQNPRHYALRAFRNRALNYRRGLWRRCLRELESRCWFEPSIPSDPLEKPAQLALARLSLDQREVIVLKIWHQLTYEQMSRLLGASPNTLAGRYRYGLEKLRAQLRNHSSHELEPTQSDRETLALLETTSSVSFP
jgi:RNA polymerase sigma-70 factor (ECF subfamily)